MKQIIFLIGVFCLVSYSKTGKMRLTGTLKGYNENTKMAVLEVRFPITVKNANIKDAHGKRTSLESLVGEKVTIQYHKTKDYQRIASDIEQEGLSPKTASPNPKTNPPKSKEKKVFPIIKKKNEENSFTQTSEVEPPVRKVPIPHAKSPTAKVKEQTSRLMRRTFSPHGKQAASKPVQKQKIRTHAKNEAKLKPKTKEAKKPAPDGSLYKVVPVAPEKAETKKQPAG